jgi:hypothetical protein
MKKNLQTNALPFIVFFFLLGTTNNLVAQVLGDYQSVATGDWLTAATWQRYDGAAWQTTTATPSITSNVTIKAGNVVSLTSTTSTPSARNLTIEAGATVNGTGTLRIYGPTLRVDGTLAFTAGTTALILEAATAAVDGTTLTITGTGSEVVVNRLRPNLAGLTIVIDINLFTNTVSGAAGIGANGKDGTVITVNAGKSVRTAGTSYVSGGASGSGDPSTSANWTLNVNGTLNVGCSGAAAGTGIAPGSSSITPATTNLNLRGTVGKTATLNVGSMGVLNIAGSLLAPDGTTTNGGTAVSATAGTANINVAAGGLITFVGYAATEIGALGTGTCDIGKATSTIAGTIDFGNSQTTPRCIGAANVTGRLRFKDGGFPTGAATLSAASIVEFYGAATLPTTAVTYPNLEINSSAGACTLGAAATVTGNMTMTVGKLLLGAFDLTLNGGLVGASGANKYFVTNGLGSLVRNNLSASTIMQIGVSETSYDPFSVFPQGTGSYKARVSAAFANPIPDASKLIQREWTVAQTAGSGAFAVTFQHDASAPLNSFTTALPKVIGRWNGTIWQELPAIYGIPLTANTFGISTGITAFGTFVVGNAGGVIPVELVTLTAKAKGTSNVVAWQTASERNNAAFIVERSSNSVDFAAIGEVKGAGTTGTPQYYSFEDASPVAGVNYYRLKQVDIDGRTATSKTVSVANGLTKSGILKTYPSVTDAVLTVDYATTGDATFKIMDMLGRTVLSKTIKNNDGFSSINLDVHALSNGMYIVSFESATSKMVEKFEKR